jgi:1-acyl-sn-glycerol-3-phosphate acyltransferase
MPRAVRVLLTGLAFLTFTIGGAIIGWFILPFSRAGGRSPRAQRRRAHEVLFGGYRLFASILRALGLLEYRPPPAGDLPRGAYVLVANHPTLLDVMLLLGTFPGVVCLVKASWFRSPFIAPLLRQGGYLPGPSDDDEDGAPVLERIVATLRAGLPVLIFPEGSRSPPGGLRRFKVGAALAAERAGVPLVPVVLRVSPPTLWKDQPWYEVPDRTPRYALERLADVPVEGDARARMRALRARYAAALGLDVSTPDEPGVQKLHVEGRHGAMP